MGVMKFSLSPDLSLEVTQQLERISMTSGHDGVPTPCQIQLDPAQLRIVRDVDESGYLSVPWNVKNVGNLIINTPTLIERNTPYELEIELARGKVNQLRNQTFDWLFGGLNMPPSLAQHIKDSTLAFCRSVGRFPSEDSREQAQNSLRMACEAADQLIHVYTNQVFKIRRQRQPLLDTFLGCRIEASPSNSEMESGLLESCNGVCIPFSMHQILPNEGDYQWDLHDELVNWALEKELRVIGGPLVDFTPAGIPSWLWLWERDRTRLGKVLCEYATDVLERYKDKITTWQVTAASNLPGVLSLKDDELLWLTLQIAETVKRTAPDVEIVVSISQPWGDYAREGDYVYSPFVFVDTLLRSGINVSALDLEIVMGVSPRGSYCRDLLDLSRLLDFFALLGIPLHVTLGYPAPGEEIPATDSDVGFDNGYWRAGLDPHTQSDWASEFGSLALCKPYVRAVKWTQFQDTPHSSFPCCGLFDLEGQSRPVLQRWRRIKEKHLK